MHNHEKDQHEAAQDKSIYKSQKELETHRHYQPKEEAKTDTKQEQAITDLLARVAVLEKNLVPAPGEYAKGEKGDKGDTGATGDPGPSLAGEKGEKGDKGDTGPSVDVDFEVTGLNARFEALLKHIASEDDVLAKRIDGLTVAPIV